MGKDRFCFRMHETQGRRILAVCDSALSGKTLDKKGIGFEISEHFYGNEKCGDAVKEMVKEADIVNVVGRDIVKLLSENDMVDENCAMMIQGIPHVQIVRM